MIGTLKASLVSPSEPETEDEAAHKAAQLRKAEEEHRRSEEALQEAMRAVVEAENAKANAREERDKNLAEMESLLQSRAKRTERLRVRAEKGWGEAVSSLQARPP